MTILGILRQTSDKWQSGHERPDELQPNASDQHHGNHIGIRNKAAGTRLSLLAKYE